MFPSVWISDINLPSPPSSESSFDEDEVNYRIKPYWPKYRNILKLRGFRLDTVRDVQEYYRQTGESQVEWSTGLDKDDMCPDPGLPDNLFRATRAFDGVKMMIKAVHRKSRELDVIRFLSSPALRRQPTNHCIPVHDLIEIPKDDIAFIVMEQWSSQLIADDGPCCMKLFLAAIRQCIEHCLFMHQHRIAHLDISLRNLLTDYKGHYAYIDFELSRRFDGINHPKITGIRGTELPPECNHESFYDPYKVDIWALAILILRACKLAGFCIPELVEIVKPMLHENPAQRPPLELTLRTFDYMVSSFSAQKLETAPYFPTSNCRPQ